MEKKTAGASIGLQYHLPCCSHFPLYSIGHCPLLVRCSKGENTNNQKIRSEEGYQPTPVSYGTSPSSKPLPKRNERGKRKAKKREKKEAEERTESVDLALSRSIIRLNPTTQFGKSEIPTTEENRRDEARRDNF